MSDTTEVLIEPIAESALTIDELVPAVLSDPEVSTLIRNRKW